MLFIDVPPKFITDVKVGFSDKIEKNKNVRLKVFSEEIGDDDISFYFCCVLTGNIMNFRNKLAHGIELRNFSSGYISDILFHVLICLSLVAKRRTSNNKNN